MKIKFLVSSNTQNQYKQYSGFVLLSQYASKFVGGIDCLVEKDFLNFFRSFYCPGHLRFFRFISL